MSALALSHLIVSASSNDDLGRAAALVRAGRIEGWMILAQLQGRTLAQGEPRPERALSVTLLAAAGLSGGEAEPSIALAAEVMRAAQAAPDTAMPEQAASFAAARYASNPGFAPVTAYCAARCPDAAEACAAAYAAGFGFPMDEIAAEIRPLSVLPLATLMASPRGERLLLARRLQTPAQRVPDVLDTPRFRRAVEISACFGEGMARARAGRD